MSGKSGAVPIAHETREVILDLRAAGWSDEAIGAQVGRTAAVIRHQIAKARAKGDPRAAYLTDEQRRLRIVAARNAQLGRPTPSARGGGGGSPPATTAALSSSSASDEADGAGVRPGSFGVSSLDCAGFEKSDPAAFSEDALEAAFYEGFSVAQLSAQFGRHPSTIRRLLSKKGLAHYVDDVKPKQKLEPAQRKCLWQNCGRMFLSRWAGERRCPKCRSRDNEGAGAWR